jgi:hypothetical protein
MNEGNESFPSTETRNRKKRYGFRYLSKKALECSRMTKRTTKGGGSEFTSITKALSFPNALSSEISITDLHDCTTESGGPPLFESVDELEGEGKEMSFGDAIFDGEYPHKVSNI